MTRKTTAIYPLILAAMTLVVGCEHDKPAADEPVQPAAAKTAEAPAAAATGCNKQVLATSKHAVGEPCQTTADFARSLGLTEAQLAKIADLKVGKTAHH